MKSLTFAYPDVYKGFILDIDACQNSADDVSGPSSAVWTVYVIGRAALPQRFTDYKAFNFPLTNGENNVN